MLGDGRHLRVRSFSVLLPALGRTIDYHAALYFPRPLPSVLLPQHGSIMLNFSQTGHQAGSQGGGLHQRPRPSSSVLLPQHGSIMLNFSQTGHQAVESVRQPGRWTASACSVTEGTSEYARFQFCSQHLAEL